MGGLLSRQTCQLALGALAYIAAYSILLGIISHRHNDIRKPYFLTRGERVCWCGSQISYS
ncbi:hypothetical protein EHJ16_09095 [Cronobacter dublinensis]|nr:hypothetical protein [Cronobacter dublinensis]